MKNLLLTVSILLFGTFVHAQWFFETSLTNNQLVSYELINSTQVATTPTVLKSINGIRDLSLGLGYLFSFQTLEQRMATDFKIPFVRLGLGLGFEQFTLRTNAVINNVTYPNVYAMAQAQGRLGVHLAPLTLYAKRTDDLGSTVIRGDGTAVFKSFNDINWNGKSKTLQVYIDFTNSGNNFIKHGQMQIVYIPGPAEDVILGFYSGSGPPTASNPANPVDGSIYVDKTSGEQYAYNSTASTWKSQTDVVSTDAGNILSQDGSGLVYLDTATVVAAEADASPTNELNTSFAVNGTNLRSAREPLSTSSRGSRTKLTSTVSRASLDKLERQPNEAQSPCEKEALIDGDFDKLSEQSEDIDDTELVEVTEMSRCRNAEMPEMPKYPLTPTNRVFFVW